MPKGGARPGAGRPKGSVNKATVEVQEILRRAGCNPFEIMAQIAMGTLECRPCGGSGQVNTAESWEALKAGISLGLCKACNGTGEEIVSSELRGRMASDLAQYVAPKRKAVEHSTDPTSDGFRIEIVKREEPSS